MTQQNGSATARRAAWDPSSPTVTTRSPGENRLTPSPADTTVPAHW